MTEDEIVDKIVEESLAMSEVEALRQTVENLREMSNQRTRLIVSLQGMLIEKDAEIEQLKSQNIHNAKAAQMSVECLDEKEEFELAKAIATNRAFFSAIDKRTVFSYGYGLPSRRIDLIDVIRVAFQAGGLKRSVYAKKNGEPK